MRSGEDSPSGNKGDHKQTARKSFFSAEGSFYPLFIPGQVVLDLNAVLRVMPQEKSLQMDSDKEVSPVTLAACCPCRAEGQAGEQHGCEWEQSCRRAGACVHLHLGPRRVPASPRGHGMCTPVPDAMGALHLLFSALYVYL